MATRLLIAVTLLTAATAAATTGVTVWANRPIALETTCPDGSEPEAAAISAVLGQGHEGVGATLLLEPQSATVQIAGAPSRELKPAERAGLLARLRHPRPVGKELAGAKAVVEVSRKCGGVSMSSTHSAGTGHGLRPRDLWLKHKPLDFNAFRSAVADEVARHDPQTQKLQSLAYELVDAAYP